MFTPKIGEDSPFDAHIFQMGGWNHQLDGDFSKATPPGCHPYLCPMGGGLTAKPPSIWNLKNPIFTHIEMVHLWQTNGQTKQPENTPKRKRRCIYQTIHAWFFLFTYIYIYTHLTIILPYFTTTKHPNVGKYTIHGCYGSTNYHFWGCVFFLGGPVMSWRVVDDWKRHLINGFSELTLSLQSSRPFVNLLLQVERVNKDWTPVHYLSSVWDLCLSCREVDWLQSYI